MAGKGAPKTGGKVKGTPNKVTQEIRDLCRVHGPAVIARLVTLTHDKSGAVAVAASRELLDRGYGKSIQPLAGSADGDPIQLEQRTVIILPPNARD
jgi:hypothetical protein